MVPAVTVGAVVSTCVTTWLHVAALLQGSAACQVRVMSSGQPLPLVTVLRIVMVTLVPVQASSALGESKLQSDPHSTVLFATQVMFGATRSTCVTTWVQVLLFKQASVACQARVAT